MANPSLVRIRLSDELTVREYFLLRRLMTKIVDQLDKQLTALVVMNVSDYTKAELDVLLCKFMHCTAVVAIEQVNAIES